MADENKGLSGRDLQESQSGGDSGASGNGSVNQQQADPAGGGATASDRSHAGGSSGTGGYGSSQDVVNQREGQPNEGAQPGLAGGDGDDLRAGGGSSDGQDAGQRMSGQSRGERFDEEQGGGRGVMFDGSGGVSDFAEDQVSHQDRGQSQAAEFDKEA